MIAFFAATSPLSYAIYIFLIFCVSYAVRPTKIYTPRIDIPKYRAGDCINIFTIEAMIIPIKPINKKEPKPVRSRFVVYP